MNVERATARSRHPSARATGGDLHTPLRALMRPAGPVAASFARVAGPHRAVAVAAAAVRGRQQRTRAQFAVAYGLTAEAVGRIEDGHVALAELPPVLRVLTPIGSVADFGLSLGPAVVGLPGRGADERLPVDEGLRQLVPGE